MKDFKQIEEQIIEKLKTIMDSELPINIYDLGLVYKIDLEQLENRINASLEMTVINSRCASTKSFTDLICERVTSVPNVDSCQVKFVFSPKWGVKMISEEGLEMLRKANNSQ